MPPERTAQTYGPGITAASRSVLLELMTVLGHYREAVVLVGGWVPYFLLTQHRRADHAMMHVGSIDIDLAMDPAGVKESEYMTVMELLAERGYRPALNRRGGTIPCSVERAVPSPLTQKPYTIRIDFLAPQTDSGPRQAQTAPVQDDLLARKVKGCEAAFAHSTTVQLSGVLPGGGEMTVPVRMADVVGILTMKGIVLGERYREKDPYHIYMLIKHYPRNLGELAARFRPHLTEPLVNEALAGIHTAFGRREANGPAWVAAFLTNPVFAAERERLVTDAFMVVNEFTTLLCESSLK